jgi:AraC-like DNA-binding protein
MHKAIMNRRFVILRLGSKHQIMKTSSVYYPYLQHFSYENVSATILPLHNDFLQSLFTIIEDKLDDPVLTVGFLATQMALSKSTLNRKLSSLVGLSANTIIKQYRLKKAATYLLQGKNVSETAYLTGFETPSYFIQCFKEFYKTTPKEFSRAGSMIKTG